MGLQFSKNNYLVEGISNAIIQMLNSNTIDVDKLDYIMRDTQMSGFDNVSIDIERLLNSFTLVKEDENFRFAYKKNAIGTIANVVLAYDAERSWIQGHPVIMYDSFLVERCIESIVDNYKDDERNRGIFQQKSMSYEGVKLKSGISIRLINDSDCLFLMKQINDKKYEKYIEEYLCRDKRKSPIWKSEAEFKMIMNNLTEFQAKRFKDMFYDKGEKADSTSIGTILNDERIKELNLEKNKISKDTKLKEEDRENTIKLIDKQLFWLEKLHDFFVSRNMNFEIFNNSAKKFYSKTNDLNNENIIISFDNMKKSDKFTELTEAYETAYKDKKKDSFKMFYWFIYKSDIFNMEDFVKALKEIANEYEKKFF